MSLTDGMNKVPGVRQNNHGWARMVREQRREEAVIRNKDYVDRGRVSARQINPSPEARLLTDIFAAEA